MAHHQFPEVKGGGSLILAWQVKNKKVLVIGGGEVSLDHYRSMVVAWERELTLTVKEIR
jgi:siroheme synthase (precorrin-2 oxidase/ferrochelatase)